jgi:phosphohistidine phosphatase
MKNLILVRHAKSSRHLPLRDIDRPLAPRGINDAQLVAINCRPFLPPNYIIWSSIAERTSETALIFAKNLSYPTEKIIYKEELYTFNESKLENVIKSCNNAFENVILFGHNEAITNFVNKFGDILIDNVPTAGFVAIQFDSNNWATINRGTIKKIIFPKDLK